MYKQPLAPPFISYHVMSCMYAGNPITRTQFSISCPRCHTFKVQKWTDSIHRRLGHFSEKWPSLCLNRVSYVVMIYTLYYSSPQYTRYMLGRKMCSVFAWGTPLTIHSRPGPGIWGKNGSTACPPAPRAYSVTRRSTT